jgi:hypothetical protein
VRRSLLPDQQYYEIIETRNGRLTIVKDFVSLRRFAEDVLRAPLDKFDTRE